MVGANQLLQLKFCFSFSTFLAKNHMEFFVTWLIKQISMGIMVILGERWEWLEGKKRGDEDNRAPWALHCTRAKLRLWKGPDGGGIQCLLPWTCALATRLLISSLWGRRKISIFTQSQNEKDAEIPKPTFGRKIAVLWPLFECLGEEEAPPSGLH